MSHGFVSVKPEDSAKFPEQFAHFAAVENRETKEGSIRGEGFKLKIP
jgi:hypothetical protein